MSPDSPLDLSAHQYTFKADPSVPSPDETIGRRDSRDENGQGDDEKGPGKHKSVNRVGRACNGCRKQKMRCEGADDPPCKRCRHARIPCLFEKPIRESQPNEQGLERIRNLEAQVGSIQSTLTELVTTLKGGVAAPAAPPPPAPAAAPVHPPFHHYSPPQPQTSPTSQNHYPVASSHGGVMSHPSMSDPMLSPIRAAPTSNGFSLPRDVQPMAMPPNSNQQTVTPTSRYPPQLTQAGSSAGSSGSSFQSQTGSSSGLPSSSLRPVGYQHDSYAPISSLPPLQAPLSSNMVPYTAVHLPPVSFPPSGNTPVTERLPPIAIHLENMHAQGELPRHPSPGIRRLSGISSPGRARGHPSVNFSPDTAGQNGSNSLTRPGSSSGPRSLFPSSNVTSAYNSDDEGELPNAGLLAPLEVLNTMAESQEEQLGDGVTNSAGKRPHDEAVQTETRNGSPERHIGDASRPHKRRRLERRAAGPHAFPDVVTKGIITEEEARELFRIYYHGCSKFLPVFEPSRDTYDTLHKRSPFCVDAICMVAAKVRDKGAKPSPTFTKCMEEVRMISSATLWLPVARREAIQAMILVAGWSTNGWLAGGHAVRMGLELGMHKAWPRLVKRIRAGKHTGSSDEHDLVVCSRIWFCLYLFEHQISFGTGRPAILKEDDSVMDCALILNHPMAVEDDMRLVSTCELMMIRERLHKQLAPYDVPVTQETFEILKRGEREFTEWFRKWDQQFATRYDDSAFYRHSLLLQRFLSELFHNAVGLRGIKGPKDVVSIPAEQRSLALHSIGICQAALDICLRSVSYKEGLKFAPDYTHVTATFAASLLVRLARLFPTNVDLDQVCADVEDLSVMFTVVPAARYARTLRTMLRAAQKRNVLPPRSVRCADGTGPSPAQSDGAMTNCGQLSEAGKQSSYSPGDMSMPAGVPFMYPDDAFLEPALGGVTFEGLPGGDMWPADQSFSAVLPSGFGYESFLLPTEMDYQEVW